MPEIKNLEKKEIDTFSDLENIKKQKLQDLMNKNISTVIDEFLQTKISTHTKRLYSKILIEFFNRYEINKLYDLELKSIDWTINQNVVEYINSKKKTEDDWNITLNKNTVNSTLYTLRSFFNYLHDTYNYTKKPTAALEPLKKNDQSNTPSLSKEQLLSILNYVKQKHIKASKHKNKKIWLRNYLIFVFLSLSLRRTEITNLKFSNIKKNKWKNFIQVYQKWWKIKDVPLNKWILYLLDKYKELRDNQNDYIIVPFSNNSKDKDKLSAQYIYDLVQNIYTQVQYGDLINSINNQIDNIIKRRDNTRRRMNRARKNNKIQKANKEEKQYLIYKKEIKKLRNELKQIKKQGNNISPHSFRKTFVELALQKDIDIIKIMNATGHSSMKMIKYYQSLDKIKHNAINEMDIEF